MYYILEIQKMQDGSYAHLVKYEQMQDRAESVYYQTLASAAISELPQHSVALLDEKGRPLQQKSYER